MSDESSELERLRYLQLKAKAAGVDPVTLEQAQPVNEVSTGKALALGAGQGATLLFGDEINGFVQALGEKYLPESLGGGGERSANKPLGVLYKSNRDSMRRENEEAEKQHKWAYLGGNVLGGATTTAPAGALGTGIKALLGTGAALGAIGGVGSSQAEAMDGEVGQLAGDTAIGAGTGVAGSLLGAAAAKALPMAMRGIGGGLERLGIRQGRRVLQGGADLRSTNFKPLADDAVREALESGAIKPLGTVGGAAKRLDALADARQKVYGEILDQLEANGVRGPEAQALASKLAGRKVEEFSKGADAVAGVFDDEASKIGRYAAGASDDRIPFLKSEEVKRRLQDAARYGKYEDTPLNTAKKEIASIFREANEKAVEEAGQAAAPDSAVRELAESFIPVKRRLARTLAAQEAAERAAGKAAQRNQIGHSGKTAIMMSIPGGPQAVAGAIGGARLLEGVFNRGASTVARGSYGAGRAANAIAQLAQNSPNRALYGGALGAGSSDEMVQALIEFLRSKPDR